MTASNWQKAMVVFSAQDKPDVAGLSHADGYRARLEHSQAQRGALLAGLVDAGLAEEVEVPDATPLSRLVIEASPRALEEIDKSPVVEKVLPIAEDVAFEIIE